jgi:NAD(P)-dependent dehydrogenase (short-subunit alcohol dehydrogenase family)
MGERLKDKVAVVIGAGSSGPGWGNGKAAAVLYAREGAKVVAVDLKREAAEETAAIIASEGRTARAVAADAVDRADVERVVRVALEAFGRIDVLHNNVGIVQVGGVEEIEERDWDRVMAVNVKSIYLACKAVAPLMAAQGKGAIVNVSSIASLRYLGYPAVSYCASKGAVNQLTQSIALQYAAKGVRANAILPGLMDTPMIREPLKGAYGAGGVEEMVRRRDAMCPTGKMGDAWDVAHAALFLASDEAKYVNGVQLVVDGGLTCKFS